MRILDIKNTFSYELAAKEAALALFKGETVVYPTDTLYALGANALDLNAVRRIFAVKKRPDKKPLPVMVGSMAMAKEMAFVDDRHEKILNSFWPGPYTFILKKKSYVSYLLTAGHNTIALRMPDHPFCQKFIADFDRPIVVTSANISGETPEADPKMIAQRFSRETVQPDLVIDAGGLPEADPSTIIDLTGSMPKVLRINPTNKENLMKILKAMQGQ